LAATSATHHKMTPREKRLWRIALLIVVVLAGLLYLIWRLWQEERGIVTVYSPVVNQGTTDANATSAELEDASITYEKIDPSTWERIEDNQQIFNTYAQSTTTQNITQTQQTIQNLTGNYVQPADTPTAGDMTGSYISSFTITSNAVALGTDTTGDYVQHIVAGDGLDADATGEGSIATLSITAGDGVIADSDGLAVRLRSGGGLTFASGNLSLLTSCDAGQLMKWDVGLSSWMCGDDDTGSGPSPLTIRETDGSPSTAPVSVLEFGPVAASSTEFVISDEGGGVARVRTGTAVPLSNATATISAQWTFSNEIIASGGLDCSDCIELSVETSGDYVADVLAGSGISVVSLGGEAGTPTVGLDSALAIFKTIDTSLGTDPQADSLTDSLQLTSGDGVNVTGNATTDAITFSANLTSGGGLSIASGGISLQSCSEGQILKQLSGVWTCATDNAAPAAAYRQHLSGADNITIGASLTPLLTNGSGTAQNLSITPATGNEVTYTATVEMSTSLIAGSVTIAVIRDDNNDNDCATGGGDGTLIGAQISNQLVSVAQSFTTTLSFADSAPSVGINRYQLCALTSIGLGTISATDRSLHLNEVNF
jgi:hypothetical protein